MIVYKENPETYTQAFHAGSLISKIENYLPKENIPPLGVCMANFHALRELLGERLWQKLKSRQKFREQVLIYEALTYQPYLPREMIGTAREFCIGYSNSYKWSKRKTINDRKILPYTDLIDQHITRVLETSVIK